jgi:hypothetical protein
MLQLPQQDTHRTRAARGAVMLITSVVKPNQGANIWSGTATIGPRNFLWFYWPRNWLHVQEQDGRIPQCWMNVEAPAGAREQVQRAIRRAKQPSSKLTTARPAPAASAGALVQEGTR